MDINSLKKELKTIKKELKIFKKLTKTDENESLKKSDELIKKIDNIKDCDILTENQKKQLLQSIESLKLYKKTMTNIIKMREKYENEN